MPDHVGEKLAARKRAVKACQRCNARKVKCDAARVGLPCTRCRVDGIEGCAFITSRRGTYARDRSKLNTCTPSEAPAHDQTSAPLSRESSIAGDATNNSNPPEPNVAPASSIVPIPTQAPGNLPSDSTGDGEGTRSNSLVVMFENFLKQQGREAEGLVGKHGFVLLGDSSPLTFALKEFLPEKRDGLRPQRRALNDGEATTSRQESAHPSHLHAADVAYLQAKGAFNAPNAECLRALIDAFIGSFYPLYSIVNKAEFLEQYQAGTIPWILLHAACLIGAAYCDLSVLKSAGFKTRQSARRFFYDKAKILYDVGYETNSVVLLQAIIILTFWGPDMKSYWNPCSWVGVAVTIAESLGIHRSMISSSSLRDKGLLRRMWWAIAVRDAYCGTLLGRPFRVNMGHCDTPMLTIEDFSSEQGQDDVADETRLSILYQIQLAKLSLILRHIINAQFNQGFSSTRQSLHEMLDQWRSELPPAINWSDTGPSTSMFAESLKILFHHHMIYIYLARQDASTDDSTPRLDSGSTTCEIAESAAQTISSTALTLMTKSMAHSMPQEVFPAFFVAGVVFFRLIRRSSPLIAQLGQAALDNCQIVLNEVRDCWDPAFWGLRIFEFLQAGIRRTGAVDKNASGTVESTSQLSAEGMMDTNAGLENIISTPEYYALQNTFEMGPAIHNFQTAAQQRQLDMSLQTQLYDRFLDPDNYFMMPTSLEPSDYQFDMSQWRQPPIPADLPS
ncbi:Cutinase transcription factor 1 beta [Exophiala dermatitidis]|uniref:Transcriptional regulatory protein AMDR n=2 Tax=Exophiala dermatitidis TaxID=5970 RepID=H6BMU8_EXODN|nr:transcriptional regulatory protein AMDR [Exophiala dermatitidis NIH/UT8656]EHY52126.1 transcriptional regulatory protein AMDR [Exophiala dermatitidis NIH/UT8656]KAJ4514781.1 hypothetical protein HRR75_004145 [Exophiala dermatitidis]KAJ4554278.1 hypothetical protein HRR78_002682 [Exophiala dermatitidis]